MRRFTEPCRWDFDTEEEYQEELAAYDAEMSDREDYYMEEVYCENL